MEVDLGALEQCIELPDLLLRPGKMMTHAACLSVSRWITAFGPETGAAAARTCSRTSQPCMGLIPTGMTWKR